MTAADKYYLKAKNARDVDEALESIDYGLSHDDEHAGLLTLKGMIYWELLGQLASARECFELALLSDNSYISAYYAYIRYSIAVDEETKAGKLLAAVFKLKGIDKAHVAWLEAMLHDSKARYSEAISKLKEARQFSCCKQCGNYYNEELERIKAKKKSMKEAKVDGS
jgi:tetratricopeptide (TPR) repeat protein